MSEPTIDLKAFRREAIEALAALDQRLGLLRTEHADLAMKIAAAEFLLGYPTREQAAPQTLADCIMHLMADGKARNAAAIRIALRGKVSSAALSTYSSHFYNTLGRLVQRGRLEREAGNYRAAILALAGEGG